MTVNIFVATPLLCDPNETIERRQKIFDIYYSDTEKFPDYKLMNSEADTDFGDFKNKAVYLLGTEIIELSNADIVIFDYDYIQSRHTRLLYSIMDGFGIPYFVMRDPVDSPTHENTPGAPEEIEPFYPLNQAGEIDG